MVIGINSIFKLRIGELQFGALFKYIECGPEDYGLKHG